ncbi:PorT family protein [candidate division WOR-3 bacterium]|nr:PorT family protein [candidate division WOR-3 bacterium]
MKFMMIFVMFLLLFFSGIQAGFTVDWGIKAGICIADQDFDYTYDIELDTKKRKGLDIGMYVDWVINSRLSLLTETHYIQKGMVDSIEQRDDQGNKIGVIWYSNRVDYLSIPILSRISFGTENINPYLIFGPRFDILIGNQSKPLESLYDEFKKFGIGGDFGIGIESDILKSVTVLIEFRYSPDLTDAYKTDY